MTGGGPSTSGTHGECGLPHSSLLRPHWALHLSTHQSGARGWGKDRKTFLIREALLALERLRAGIYKYSCDPNLGKKHFQNLLTACLRPGHALSGLLQDVTGVKVKSPYPGSSQPSAPGFVIQSVVSFSFLL